MRATICRTLSSTGTNRSVCNLPSGTCRAHWSSPSGRRQSKARWIHSPRRIPVWRISSSALEYKSSVRARVPVVTVDRLVGKAVWEGNVVAGEDPRRGSIQVAEDGRCRPDHRRGGGAGLGIFAEWHWTKADSVHRASGTSRADGDGGATATGDAPLGRRYGDRRGSGSMRFHN